MFYVSEITPEEITTSVNRDELHGDNSPEQNLAEYLTEKEKSPEDAQRIIELARPIISEAMEKGRLETPTGVFMPVEIEVKNYRNYRDELFSYDGISFATINGENGAGKSSCLWTLCWTPFSRSPGRRPHGLDLQRPGCPQRLHQVHVLPRRQAVPRDPHPHKERQGDAESLRVCGRELAEPQRGEIPRYADYHREHHRYGQSDAQSDRPYHAGPVRPLFAGRQGGPHGNSRKHPRPRHL